MRYTVTRAYKAARDGQVFGPWAAGDCIDVDVETAEWVNRDSPGVLVPEVPPAPKVEPEPEPELERMQRPAPDRQLRGSKNRGA